MSRAGERCAVCGGNNADNPCAYPGEGVRGCLREESLAWHERANPQCVQGGDACIDCLCMGQCIGEIPAADRDQGTVREVSRQKASQERCPIGLDDHRTLSSAP